MTSTTENTPRETFAGVATDLRPGDLVVDDAGERLYAAFDRFVGHEAVTVWTGVADQDRGLPRLLDLELDAPVRISRKVTAR